MVGTNTGSLQDQPQWRNRGKLCRAEWSSGGIWEPSDRADQVLLQVRRVDLLQFQNHWCWLRLGNSWEL